MKLDKIKGSLVDFNELEVILDDVDGIGSWQIELAKTNNDPMDVDELDLHLSLEPSHLKEEVEDLVRRRFREVAEITPNEIAYHSAEEMRLLRGVEKFEGEKIVDNRSVNPYPPPNLKPTPRRRRKERRS